MAFSSIRSIRAHACARAKERYGVSLDDAEMRLLGNKIMLGQCEEFEREGRRTSKVFVRTDGGMALPVIYSHKRRCIVTVLPPDAEEVKRALAKHEHAPAEEKKHV